MKNWCCARRQVPCWGLLLGLAAMSPAAFASREDPDSRQPWAQVSEAVIAMSAESSFQSRPAGEAVPSPQRSSNVQLDVGFAHYRSYPYYHHYWYRPFYGWPYWSYPYGAYPYAVRSVYVYPPDSGALNIHLRPKKAAVYVDGQYVGLAKQFDGYPGYLWLAPGSYEVIFYRQGYQTLVRHYTVRAGAVIKIQDQMIDGESIPPEELRLQLGSADSRQSLPPAGSVVQRGPSGNGSTDADRRGWKAAPKESGAGQPPADLRAAPAQLRLWIRPPDASVYLDGRFLGSGEEIARLHSGLMLDAGEHLLEVLRPGYASRQQRFTVEAGEDLELDIELTSE